MKTRRYLLLSFLTGVVGIWCFSIIPAMAQSGDGNAVVVPVGKLTIEKAMMCEGIESYSPVNPAIVFSVSLEKVLCFSSFDPVPSETYIFHRWFHKDRLSTERKLYLKPPRWSTFSGIQLREADKGPWRVDIVDKDGKLFKSLRFSVAD